MKIGIMCIFLVSDFLKAQTLILEFSGTDGLRSFENLEIIWEMLAIMKVTLGTLTEIHGLQKFLWSIYSAYKTRKNRRVKHIDQTQLNLKGQISPALCKFCYAFVEFSFRKKTKVKIRRKYIKISDSAKINIKVSRWIRNKIFNISPRIFFISLFHILHISGIWFFMRKFVLNKLVVKWLLNVANFDVSPFVVMIVITFV